MPLEEELTGRALKKIRGTKYGGAASKILNDPHVQKAGKQAYKYAKMIKDKKGIKNFAKSKEGKELKKKALQAGKKAALAGGRTFIDAL